VAGDLQTHASVCAALALAGGCDVFALHYRRPPESRFPGPIEDVLDALDHLRRGAESLGLDAARLGLGGDSAGANLAAAASHDPRAGALALRLLICPILDLPRAAGSRTTFGQGYFLSRNRLDADARDYLQGISPEDIRASPLRSPSLGRAAVTLVHAAAYDPFRDEALDYAARLQAEGATVALTVHPGMIHYFYAMPKAIPYARRALAMIGAQVMQAFRAV
jgi:acetyl esterase/lipase